MKNFTATAKSYLIIVLLFGGVLTLWQLTQVKNQVSMLLLAACALAALLQSFKIEGTTERTSYNLSWVVYGFVLVSSGAPAMILVIFVAHLVEWIFQRYPWYIQSFNIASFAIAATIAGLIYDLFGTSQEPFTFTSSLAILVAAGIFTMLNHLLVGFAVKLVRGQSLTESGVFSPLTLSLDYGMLCLGAVGALIWLVNPYAIILVALLAYLLQNVLRVPALRRQTETDPKVNVFNARYFAETVEHEITRANRFNRPLSLVMADLDFLRRVNNIYGHLAGDVVLKGVAQILQASVRDLDVVARFGGEEFAILMPETTPEQAFLTAERIREAITKAEFSVATSVAPIKVTMSFGIAGRLERDLTANELIHRADLAVIEAKQEGRNCSRIYGRRVSNISSSPARANSPLSLGEKIEDLPATSGDIVVPSKGSGTEDQNLTKSKERLPLLKRLEPTFRSLRPMLLKVYVLAVASIAAFLIYLVIQPLMSNDWLGLTAFLILVVLAEVLSVDIYAKETSVSTSVAALVAGVVLFGPIAAVVLGLGVALAAFFRQRSRIDRLIFNSSNHVIGGMIAAGIVLLNSKPFLELTMPLQFVITLLAIGLIYLSTTVLVAGAVSLNHSRPLLEIWGERFRWLAPYYLALGVVAYTLVFSFSTAGLLGIAVVLVPLAMLRLSQKQYIEHTKNVVSQLREQNVKLTQQSEEINLLNEELLITLAKANDLRDPYVMEHSQNVARYAELIAKELGLPAERVEMVRKAGLLHDIGKLSLPDAILFKPGRLSEEEYDTVKEHVIIGADLIQGCHSLRPLSPIIRHHHEHFNGAGYPDGLDGEQIPLEARILGVADALEAMASDRPYRHGRTPQGIVEELEKYSNTQFDPEAVEAFIRVVERDGEAVIVNSAREVMARQNADESTNSSSFAINPALATG